MLEAAAVIGRHGIAFDPLPVDSIPPIMDLDPGGRLLVSLWQYGRNAPLEASHRVGHRVKAGEVIAKALDGQGVYVHAPVAGRHAGMCEVSVASADRPRSAAVEIVRDADADDCNSGLFEQPANSVSERLSRGGIRGLGGAGFPTHLKLGEEPSSVLVVNLMESDPEIQCDRALFASLGSGCALNLVEQTAALLGIPNSVIAVPSETPILANTYERNLPDSIKVVGLPNSYALGDSTLLLRTLCKALPCDPGNDSDVVVLNFQTLYAIRELLAEGKPMRSRLITAVDADAGRTMVFRVRFGTPLRRIAQQIGLNVERTGIRYGGISSVQSLDPEDVVGVTTNSVVFAPVKTVRRKQSVCIGCGWCDRRCPAGIQPQRLLSLVRQGAGGSAAREGLLDCVLCRTCDWVCPSGIPIAEELGHAINAHREAQTVQQRKQDALERKKKLAAARTHMHYTSPIEKGDEEAMANRLVKEALRSAVTRPRSPGRG